MYHSGLAYNHEQSIGESYDQSVAVSRHLDWFDAGLHSFPSEQKITENSFDWSKNDLSELKQLDFIVATDVIYDANLTEAFFSALKILVENSNNSNLVIYLAIEKRFNFSIENLSVVATGYKSMLSHINIEGEENCAFFNGIRMPLDFPKSFRYNRTPQMEIWELKQC